MNAGKLTKISASLGMLLLVSSCTVSCNAKEAGAKENADALKNFVERARLKMAKSVTCPPNSKQKKGAKFDCKVVFNDGEVQTWQMEWIDESLFKASAYLHPKMVEEDLRKRIKKAFKVDPKDVTCPKKIRQAAGASYTCVVTDTNGEKIEFPLEFDKKGIPNWGKPKKAGGAKTTTPTTKPATPTKNAATPAKKAATPKK